MATIEDPDPTKAAEFCCSSLPWKNVSATFGKGKLLLRNPLRIEFDTFDFIC
jgi:hypothetical protein